MLTVGANENTEVSAMDFRMKLASVAVTRLKESGGDARSEAELVRTSDAIVAELYETAKAQGVELPEGAPKDIIPDKVDDATLATLTELLSGF